MLEFWWVLQSLPSSKSVTSMDFSSIIFDSSASGCKWMILDELKLIPPIYDSFVFVVLPLISDHISYTLYLCKKKYIIPEPTFFYQRLTMKLSAVISVIRFQIPRAPWWGWWPFRCQSSPAPRSPRGPPLGCWRQHVHLQRGIIRAMGTCLLYAIIKIYNIIKYAIIQWQDHLI